LLAGVSEGKITFFEEVGIRLAGWERLGILPDLKIETWDNRQMT
jgi:hypothetical protein